MAAAVLDSGRMSTKHGTLCNTKFVIPGRCPATMDIHKTTQGSLKTQEERACCKGTHGQDGVHPLSAHRVRLGGPAHDLQRRRSLRIRSPPITSSPDLSVFIANLPIIFAPACFTNAAAAQMNTWHRSPRGLQWSGTFPWGRTPPMSRVATGTTSSEPLFKGSSGPLCLRLRT